MKILIDIPSQRYDEIRHHLFGKDPKNEQAAFVYAQQNFAKDWRTFEFVDWYPVPPDGFEFQTPYYIELTDETKAKVIKKAHDLNSCLIEFHSHLGKWPARFSYSDLNGFEEFVPHVWWRLKGKPYLAVVMTDHTFDALAWVSDAHTPQIIEGIKVNDAIFPPTCLSLVRREIDERK